MRKRERSELPEMARLTRYYEHDGMLRAYANRAMFLATMFGIIAISSLGFAIYVRVLPPTVIHVNDKGEANVVGGGVGRERATSQLASMLSAQASSPETAGGETPSAGPTDVEGKAVVRRFLEHYLAYTPDSVARNFAESLNMMTANLRNYTMNKLRDDDTIGKIRTDHIITDFRIRSMEAVKSSPWSYVVFGVKEVHKLRNGSEVTDRIVAQYNVRLVEERRTEFNPSGLLVGEYSEKQMVGDRALAGERAGSAVGRILCLLSSGDWPGGSSGRPEAVWRPEKGGNDAGGPFAGGGPR